jgi:predicted DNA-binding WGR domain protein
MLEQFEFIHDSKNSKIWSIEKIGKKIYIKFGKKGSKLQEKEFVYKTEIDAQTEYNNRLNEKIKKGYEKTTLNLKSTINQKTTIDKTKIEKISKISNISKESNSKINIETVNLFINFLIKIGERVGKEMYKLEKTILYKKGSDDSDLDARAEIYDEKISKFFNDRIESIRKQIDRIQSKSILPFIKSGVIVKNINNKLKSNLLTNINNFSYKKIPDYHPGSNNKVLDIVHPSLYPLITDIKKTNGNDDFWNRPYEDSKYQWLPSEFKIDKDGRCKIESYINNLPISERSLYENIEELFESVLPQLEDIWSYSNTFEFYNGDWLDNPTKNKFKKIELRDRNLQVITKIVEISLKDKDNLMGAWHVEGMSHENIVATATCTLKQDKDFDTRLYFKRFYSSEEVESIVTGMPQDPPAGLSNLLHDTLVPLGKVKITEGTIVVFPNSHIHKVDMTSFSKSEQTRTIIVFWLINPDIRITSTKDIPQQKYSMSTAYKNRLELMKERTFYKQTFNQRELNLCEH